MYVEAHELFKRFMQGLEAEPEASLVHSLAEPPVLGDFISDLDPEMSLDWSGENFQGKTALREKVLKRTRNEKVCQIGDVLITAGTAEANFLAITQLVQAGDEMIVDVPGWPQPLVLGQAIGANIKKLIRDEENDWRFDLNTLEDLISSKTRLIFLCNPNNPTGQIISESELKEIVRLADKAGAYVLCDEVYAELEWTDAKIPRVASLYERGISTGSVSKALGLQGLRTGWLICRDPRVVYDAMVLREDSSEIMNIMGETLANLALSDKYYEKIIEKSKYAGRENLFLLDEFVSGSEALQWYKPAAGLIGFCKLRLDMNSNEFARQLMQEPYRTFVMPGSAYDYPQHLRMGFGGKAVVDLQQGLERLYQFLGTLEK